jgi:hypothetical protein
MTCEWDVEKMCIKRDIFFSQKTPLARRKWLLIDRDIQEAY